MKIVKKLPLDKSLFDVNDVASYETVKRVLIKDTKTKELKEFTVVYPKWYARIINFFGEIVLGSIEWLKPLGLYIINVLDYFIGIFFPLRCDNYRVVNYKKIKKKDC